MENRLNAAIFIIWAFLPVWTETVKPKPAMSPSVPVFGVTPNQKLQYFMISVSHFSDLKLVGVENLDNSYGKIGKQKNGIGVRPGFLDQDNRQSGKADIPAEKRKNEFLGIIPLVPELSKDFPVCSPGNGRF